MVSTACRWYGLNKSVPPTWLDMKRVMAPECLKRMKAKMDHTGRVGLLGAVLVSTAVWGQAPPALPQQQGSAQRAAPVNAMSEAARSVGVKRCWSALDRLSSLSLRGAVTHDIVLDWDRQAPDTSPFFGLMGVTMPNTGTHATTFTAVPDPTGACTVLAERMAWAPKPCGEVAREELAGYTVSPLLPGMAVLLHPKDPGSTISLMDAGPGCMVLRRFVQFRWQDPTRPEPLAVPPGAKRP